MNAVVPMDATRRERTVVVDAVPVLDTSRFEQMQRIASVMARSPLVPDCLRYGTNDYGDVVKSELLPVETAMANCFLVTNQAVRWGLDPFAVAQCCSIVRGRLMFEGKLVAAVLAAKLGVQLSYAWNDKTGDAFGVLVRGPDDDLGNARTISGTVGEWKTERKGSPWGSVSGHRRMLAYRGTREWVRLYEPAILLGVYTPDEMDDMQETARATRAAPARVAAPEGPPRRLAAPAPALVEAAPAPAASLTPTASITEPDEDEVEAALVQFEADAAAATILGQVDKSRELLDDLQLSRPQQRRVEDASEAAKARIWKEAQKVQAASQPDGPPRKAAAASQAPQPDPAPMEEQAADDSEDDAPAIDTENPDYQRGMRDHRDGVKRCVISAIRNDPARHEAWQAGWMAGANGDA
ncbi:hypothetical protein [Methylobacterium aquaticum]|uniref:Recombinase RecT n=1 Tax=Methylobacterium aquaticum TaxID=270351 RepID=A0A1Y0Z8J7_9HYPH|nr:hypothetical protein [Methylobacterium aquaticum]BAR47069.1 hypothetical protein Maq22A_c27815 [Methylobacterium aquaticum]